MTYLVIPIVGLIEAGAACYVMSASIAKKKSEVRKNIETLHTEVKTKEELVAKFNALYDQMVDIHTLRENADEFKSRQESLKAERGRITITQAELETVDSRLRELEEIERELEASSIETKEEFNILVKKKDELYGRNENLRQQLDDSLQQMQSVMSEIEMSAQIEQRVSEMQAELSETRQKIDLLLEKIEEGNQQYFILKKRYDALDIEYAQLYEKFSAAEVMGVEEGGS